jgi:subtilisin-like proprotein convertase family protein
LLIGIPAAGSSGAASRYPATINVFGQPTNFNTVSVAVALMDLSHQHSADIDVLLVSPSGKTAMLIAHAGGTNTVDVDLLFRQSGVAPPQTERLYSGTYSPSNYGGITNMPHLGLDPPPPGPYSTNLYDLEGDDPNGVWRLYIYDDHVGGSGSLSGSSSQGTWQLHLSFQ